MRSLKTTSCPITSRRAVPPGARPEASGFTALLIPTRCCARSSGVINAKSIAAISQVRYLTVASDAGASLKVRLNAISPILTDEEHHQGCTPNAKIGRYECFLYSDS